MMLRLVVFPVLTLAAVSAPGAAGAQIVVGRVLDSLTAAPISTAAVMLLDSSDVAVDWAETDSLGRFVLRAPAVGDYRLFADRLAYREVFSEDLPLWDAGSLEVLLRMAPRPVELDALTVTAEGRLVKLEDEGFYRRQAFAPGYFFDVEEIEKWKPTFITDMLRSVPSVSVRRVDSTGAVVPFNRRSYRGCPMKVVLDGYKVDVYSEGLDFFAPAVNVIGIEVYPSGVGAPIQHRGLDAFCGIIMIWTR